MARPAHALFAAALAFALVSPAYAADDPWAGLEVMDDGELAELRGGLRVSDGLDIGFGAVITTYSNGAPVMQTHLNWTDAGEMIERTYGSIGTQIDTLPAEARAVLGIDGMTGAGGVVINDAQGVTALMHHITDGALQNIIVNNASGRDLRQEIDVTLRLPNFEAMQGVFDIQRLGLRIDADMTAAITATGG